MKRVKVVAYVRYSSDNQREESIAAQLRAIEDYCKRNGYLLVKVYSDEAKTATTDQRSGFLQMIKDSELGLFDIVIVHKLDRFARNRYDSAFYKRILKKNGVKLESVLEPLDNSPESIILESVLEGMAEYYSKNLAREVRKGQIENAGKGLHNGGRPPYGLKVNPTTKQYEIDETRSKAVQMYFEGIAAGLSVEKIAEQINDAGFRTYTGNKFTRNSFDGWAYNRKYKGDYTWDVAIAKSEGGTRNNHAKKPLEQQTVIPGVIPAIISKDLWERVSSLMKDRKHAAGRMKAKINYLLSGKVFCGNSECSKSYVGESYKSRNNFYAYYKCSGKCGNKNVKKDELEEIVIEKLIDICFTTEAINAITQRVKTLYAERHNNIDSEIEPIQKELAELEKKINNWIEAIGEGLLDKNILAEKIKEAQEKREFLETELNNAMIIKNTNQIDDNVIIKVLENKKHLLFSDNDEDRKQVLQEYVDTVIILYDGDELSIDLTVRVFNGGDELTLLETLTITKYKKAT